LAIDDKDASSTNNDLLDVRIPSLSSGYFKKRYSVMIKSRTESPKNSNL